MTLQQSKQPHKNLTIEITEPNKGRAMSATCWLLAFQALCFAGAGLSHARAIWLGGWLPYVGAPVPINAFWTGLAAVDPVTAWLLLRRPRLGTVLALGVMLADVGVNSYVKYAFDFGGG